MVNTKCLNKLLPLVFMVCCVSSLLSQELLPQVDQVYHLKDVTHIAISKDYKYYATADDDGLVTFRDVATGKVITKQDYDGKIDDIAFSEEEGCLVVVYSIEYDEFVTIEHYDFIRDKFISEVGFQNIDVYGVDFNTSVNQVLISLIEGKPLLVNYKEKTIDTIRVESDYSNSSFDGEGKCIVYCENFINEDKEVFKYDPNSKKIVSIGIVKETDTDLDLNNRLSYLQAGNFVFEDFILNAKASVPVQDYLDDGVSTIKNFAFSPDGKFLAITGGKDTKESSGGFGIGQEESGSGYVALYSLKGFKQEWRTTNKKNQPQFKVTDVAWTDEETFIAVDEKGNIYSMSIGEDEYFDVHPRPRYEFTYSDINTDLSTIVYSQKDLPTYKFDIKDDGDRELVSLVSSSKISTSNNKVNAFNWQFIGAGVPINNNVIGLDKVLNYPTFLAPNSLSMALSEDGKYYAISTVAHASNGKPPETLTITDVQKSSTGTTEKVETSKYTFISVMPNDLSLLGSKGIGDTFILDDVEATVIYNLREDIKPIVFLDTFEELEFSFDSRYLSIGYVKEFEASYKILDLDKQSWFSIDGQEDIVKFNGFDKYHPYAFSFCQNKESIVWNTTTGEILFKDILIDEGTIIGSAEAEYSDLANLEGELEYVSFSPEAKEVYLQLIYDIYVLNIIDGSCRNYDEDTGYNNSSLSPDGQYLFVEEEIDNRTRNILIHPETGRKIYEEPIIASYESDSEEEVKSQIYFHENSSFAFIHDGHGTFDLVDLTKQDIAGKLKFFENGEWVFYTTEGLFDGSKQGRNTLYYTYGTEVILFNQIKDRYWEPDLLYKVINNPGLIATKPFENDIALYPRAVLNLDSDSGELTVNLIGSESKDPGAVSLYINNKEVEPDINPERSDKISVNIMQDKYRSHMFREGTNVIHVITDNSSGTVHSRPYAIYLRSNLAKDKGTGNENEVAVTRRRRRQSTSTEKPGLFGLFVGTSEYQNEKLKLNYADKDAKDLEKAFKLISSEMYNQDRVKLTSLYSSSQNPDSLATKENILREFGNMQAQATANDIIVLFFSGHGLTIEDDFYYLTSTAGKVDLRADSLERVNTCLSSLEIKEGLKDINSNKQIMILDACHSGQITNIFQANDKATSTTLNKALENLEDKMGIYVLASSESNQKSFETETLQQGLLTFALKYGMSGEASEDKIIDVAELLTFASINAEQIGKEIMGKSQRPVLGITHGGNPFPVGLKNEQLKVELPQKKLKFTTPRFIVLTSFADPKNIGNAVKENLESRGGIGTNESFVFSKNEVDPDAIKIAGSYKEVGSNIELEWNLLKKEEVWKGPIKKTVSKEDLPNIGNIIINDSLEKVE